MTYLISAVVLVVVFLVVLGAVLEGGGHGPRVRVSRGVALGRVRAGKARASMWWR